MIVNPGTDNILVVAAIGPKWSCYNVIRTAKIQKYYAITPGLQVLF